MCKVSLFRAEQKTFALPCHRPARDKWLFLALVLFCFMLVTRHQWSADIRDSDDDVTYLSYAMSMGIDGDLDFSNELKCCQNMALNGRVPGGFYGAGLLAAPFVAAFSLLDRALENPVITDRSTYLHSWSYFGFSFAVHAYFLLAVQLLWWSAQRFNPTASLPMLLLMAVGSGVYYFVFGRPRMAHGFEFFALALAVHGATGMIRRAEWRRVWPSAIEAALGAVLAVAIRFSDLNVLLLPAILLLFAACIDKTAALGKVELSRRLTVYGLALAMALVPLALFNELVYDHAVLSSHVVYGVTTQLTGLESGDGGFVGGTLRLLALLPGLLAVIFGSEFGLLYTDPVAVVGVALAILLLLRSVLMGHRWLSVFTLLLVLGYCLFSLLIVLLWKSPGMSFGYRSLFPLFPLGFAGWWLWHRQTELRWRQGVQVLLVALCLLSLAGQALFTKTPHLSYREGTSALGLEGKTAIGFETALLKDMLTVAPWNVTLKDGPYGYVSKMYFSKAYLGWLAERWQGRDVAPPERQHPPIDGLFLALLALLWGVWSVRLVRT